MQIPFRKNPPGAHTLVCYKKQTCHYKPMELSHPKQYPRKHFSGAQFSYCLDSQKTFIVEDYVGCRVFLLPPSSTPPLPHPHTHPSSHPPGTYLSVAFIHNPRDLNLFPPHRPRLFLSLLFLKNFMLSSLSSFFFFLFTLLLFLNLSFFCFLFVPIKSKIPASVPARKKWRGGGEDEH